MKLVNASMIKAATKSVEKFVKTNAPQILAGLGIACGLGAVGMTAKGTVSAYKKVKAAEEEKGEKLTKMEIVKTVWTDYAPAAALTVAGIGCVVGSVHISARRVATLGLAYAMSDKNLKEYQAKAKEVLGEKKEEELRASIDQDYVNANPPSTEMVERAKGGTVLCLDKLLGRYFYSDADTINRAANELNRLMLADYAVSYNDWLFELDREPCDIADSLKWKLEDGELIQPTFDTVLGPNNEPVLVVDFIQRPRPCFHTIRA